MKLVNFQSNQNVLSRNTKTQALLLEKKTKVLESTVKYLDNSECITCKAKLDQLYDEKANGIRLRNKCDWYEYLSFRNLE